MTKEAQRPPKSSVKKELEVKMTDCGEEIRTLACMLQGHVSSPLDYSTFYIDGPTESNSDNSVMSRGV